nr:MAG TPA: hypothetical protein [Crassvirales sp.]
MEDYIANHLCSYIHPRWVKIHLNYYQIYRAFIPVKAYGYHYVE